MQKIFPVYFTLFLQLWSEILIFENFALRRNPLTRNEMQKPKKYLETFNAVPLTLALRFRYPSTFSKSIISFFISIQHILSISLQ